MFWPLPKISIYKPEPMPMYSVGPSNDQLFKLLQLRDLISQKEFLILKASRDTNKHRSWLTQLEEEMNKIQPKINAIIEELSGVE